MSLVNFPPWLDILDVQQRFSKNKEDISTQTLIIWWWIAWCTTAYQLLLHTDKQVVLVDAGKIAYWATGHNAWQIDVFFEKPIQSLVEQYGKDMAKSAYEAMFFAWEMLEDIITYIWKQPWYMKYIWYNVYTTYEQYKRIQKQMMMFDELGLQVNEIFIRKDQFDKQYISSDFTNNVNSISKHKWDQLIGTKTLPWLFFESTHYALLNSAELCYSMIQFLCDTYPQRFSVFEETPIVDITQQNNRYFSSTAWWHLIQSDEIVFCTNGYWTPKLIHITHTPLNVKSVTWMMAWYIIPQAKSPLTVGYEDESADSSWDEYFYQSVRAHTNVSFEQRILVSVWWPNSTCKTVTQKKAYLQSLSKYIQKYYTQTYEPTYLREWVMWYTKSWLRKIWPDPLNNWLWYNVWCNGVGILWSIYWAWKIVEQMNWIKFPPSVFDI